MFSGEKMGDMSQFSFIYNCQINRRLSNNILILMTYWYFMSLLNIYSLHCYLFKFNDMGF